MDKNVLNWKYNWIADRYTILGNDMVNIINEFVKDVTDNGSKTIVVGNFPPISDFWNEIYFDRDEENTYMVEVANGNEVCVADLYMDDWFTILTYLSSENENYKIV